MKILEQNAGWTTAIIDGRWIQAKVYDEGSEYGINGGRVSKLVICKDEKGQTLFRPFYENMEYAYDRGLDFDNLPAGVLDSIVAQLEALPVT